MKDTTQRVIMFAMPCRDQTVWTTAMVSLYGALHRCTARGWGNGVETFGGQGGIHIIRNWFCKLFLDSACTDLFFLDSDIAADPEAYIRMIEHPVDVVIGAYRGRTEQEIYPLLTDGVIYRDIVTGLVAVRAGPAGFARIRRHVIEKMANALRGDEWAEMPCMGGRVPTLFNFEQREGHYLGEDTHFFLKWEEMGGTTWVDPDIELQHFGTKNYTSTFSTFLMAQERERRQADAFEALTNGR